MKILKRLLISRQLYTYLVIGISAFAVEYLLFATFISASVPLIVAQTISFCGGLFVSFFGNRMMTFKKHAGYALSSGSQLWRYGVLALVNLILSNVLIHVLVESMIVLPLLAKVIVMGMVVLWNYLIFNKIIFQKKA